MMKNFFLLLISSTLFLTFNACQNGAGTVHVHGNGASPKIDDIATFDFTVKKDTSIIFSTVQQGRPAQEPISDPNNSEDPLPKFMMKSLMSMRVGDSTSFIMKLDTMKTPPAGFTGGKQAVFSIALRKVQSEKEFLATLPSDQQKQFMMQKKIVDVQKRLSKLKPQMDAAEKDMMAASEGFKLRAKATADSTASFAAQFKNNTLGAGIMTTPSGLKYLILKEGSGAVAQQKQLVWVNYAGYTKDGKPFDDSYSKGQPFVFALGIGQVIPAWDEAIALFKPGTIAVVFVPSGLGYGAQGSGNGTIPANSDLVFYMEVLRTI